MNSGYSGSNFLTIFTASSISLTVDIPVDNISGLPVNRIRLIKSVSVNEADANLYNGVSNCSIKFTASTSQVDTNQSMPCSRQYWSIAAYSSTPNSVLRL